MIRSPRYRLAGVVLLAFGVLLSTAGPGRAADPYTLGLEAFSSERYEAAIRHFQDALERRSDFPPYNYHLAMSYLRNGQRSQAVEAFEAVIRHPDAARDLREKASVNLMRTLVDAERYEEVERLLEREELQVPSTADVLNQLGRARLNRGDYEGAIRVLTKATQQDTASWTIYNNLGLAYLNAGNLKGAKIAFERAAELSSRLPFIYNNLGHVHESLGNYDAAAGAFQKALAIDPNYKKARIALKRVKRLRARENTKSYVLED